MPRSWNIRRLLRLDSKTNVNHEADIKTGGGNSKPTSNGTKQQKRKAPTVPGENSRTGNISAQAQFFLSPSTSSGSFTSSSTTGYSPSSRSFSSSTGSVGNDSASANEAQRDLAVRDAEITHPAQSGLSNQNLSLNSGLSLSETSKRGRHARSLDSLGSASFDQTKATTKTNFSSSSATDLRNNETPPNCSNISDYVEKAILESSNQLSSSPSKQELPSEAVACSHLPPRLLSFESSSTLNHEGLAKDVADSGLPTDTGFKPHYVSLDFVKSAAAADGRSRLKEKEDDQNTLRSTSSVSSSFISTVGSEDGSTIGSDVVENLYNKITAATARHSLKNPSFQTHPTEASTGDIEKDLFPLIFPGRLASIQRSEDGSSLSLNKVDRNKPPNNETSPSAKVDDFLQRNFNNNNNNRTGSNKSSQQAALANDGKNPEDGLSPAVIATEQGHNGIRTCEFCSGVICDSNNDESHAAMIKAKDIFGQCLCGNGEGRELVTEIDYCNSNLKEVPSDIWDHADTLVTLLLESNTITELPKELFNCQNLRFLSVSDNDVTTLPLALASLVNLNHLDISKNVVEDLPECIRCCKNLQVLDASVNPIERLSEGFTQLMSLRELYMNDCFFDFLPANFGRMSQLRVLELRDNQLQILPKSMRRLTQLTRLDLGGNAFQEWPEVIFKLTNLTELWLDCNELSKVPPDIGDLSQLKYLDLSRNFLEAIPNQIGSLEQLTDLLLSENSLLAIPDTIGFLSKLTLFNLDFNQVSSMPESFGKLRSLEEFDVSHNKLESLPTSIGNLRSLHTLLLDDNKLTSIPSEIGLCKAMNILQISRNIVDRLPETIGDLSQLRVFNVCQNRLPYLPISMIKLSGLEALWISPNQSKPNVPLEAKLDKADSRRILTNILFPQSENDLSRANKVLSLIGNNDEYANDAADDDDLEAYANRERGKTQVFFNLDAITYSTDEKNEMDVDYDQDDENERIDYTSDSTIDALIKQGDEKSSLPEVVNSVSCGKHENVDEYSISVSNESRATGLSVFSSSRDTPIFKEEKPTMKTANILKVKQDTDRVLEDSDEETFQNGYLKEQYGNLRSLTKEIPQLTGFKSGYSEQEGGTPTEDEDIPLSAGLRTWSSHSNLPTALTEQTVEWNPDEVEILKTEEKVAPPFKNTASRLPLPTRITGSELSTDAEVNSQAIKQVVEIPDPNLLQQTNGFAELDNLNQEETKASAINNTSNLLDCLEQLAKQKHNLTPEKEQRVSCITDNRGTLLHASSVTSADKSRTNDAVNGNSKRGQVVPKQPGVPIFQNIPFMDNDEDMSAHKTVRPELAPKDPRLRNPAHPAVKPDGIVESSNFNLRHNRAKAELRENEIKFDSKTVASKREDLQEQENYQVSSGFVMEGKPSSVTSGESLPATDHDSGVGNDVESQESIPDVQEENNDLDIVIPSPVVQSNSTASSMKNNFEPTSNRYVGSSALRKDERGWIGLVRINDTTEPNKVSLSNENHYASPKALHHANSTLHRSASSQPNLEDMRVSQTRYAPSVPVDSTTVTYSHDYNNSRIGKDKQKSLRDNSNNNRVSDNIKKFEKFSDSAYAVPPPKSVSSDNRMSDKNFKNVSFDFQPKPAINAKPKPPTRAKPTAVVTILPNTKSLKTPSTAPLARPEAVEKADNVTDVFTINRSVRTAPKQSPKNSDWQTQNGSPEAQPVRRVSGHQRKSKFEEALAATKHKHFRDKLEEKMMQQRNPPLSSSCRSSRFGTSDIAHIPRITSPVPRALSPHANSTPLEHLTADSNWSPEMSRPEGRRDSDSRKPKLNSLHSRLKEKLGPANSSYSNEQTTNPPPRKSQAPAARPLGRRGSTQRSSMRSLSGNDVEEKNGGNNEADAKKSLEEQLGQLLLDGSLPSPRQQEDRGFKPYVLEDQRPRHQSHSEVVNDSQFPPPISRKSATLNQNNHKAPMPADWKHQLLRHIERKKHEKDEITAVQSVGRRPSDQDPRARAKSPFTNERYSNQELGLPRNSQTRRSFARNEGEGSQPMTRSSTVPEVGSSLKRNSVAAGEQKPNNFVRGAPSQSKMPGRRSSGRFLRTRTPGPEMISSEPKRVDLAIRPKSAMDMPSTMPASFDPTPYGNSDWDLGKRTEPKQEKSRTLFSTTAAPPSYEDHILRQATAAEKQDYHDYVNVEYVNQLRSSVRNKRTEKQTSAFAENSLQDLQGPFPLRSTGSHESVLNSKTEKQYTYDIQPPVTLGMRGSSSHDSALDNPYQQPSHRYHQPQPAYHESNTYAQLTRIPHGYEPQDYGVPRYHPQYLSQVPQDRKYGVIPTPMKTSRRSKKATDHREHDKNERSHYDDRYYKPPPPHHHRHQDHQLYPPPPAGFNDNYGETVAPLSSSLQRTYGEREDESVASAFRPYHQHQNHPRQQPPPTHGYHTKPQALYDDHNVYQSQHQTLIDHHRHHHRLDRGGKARPQEQIYKHPSEHSRHRAGQYNRIFDDDHSPENDPSPNGELSRHWRETEPGVDLVTVTVCKNPTFGFHIMGGIDAGGNPYRPDDDGVFITYVAPAGAADGSVQPGDKILLVNGSDFVGITHKRAVDLLRNAGHVAVLVVERLKGRAV
ncbi:unnamed protein product [Clavelina lepadiformis]|uniref:PDZ domain-containing protein n=2 Tax=Clavelina lepadiformis TaxID=159417 RepID=A0ABP0F837_CLALP